MARPKGTVTPVAKRHIMKTYWKVAVNIHSFLTLDRDESQLHASGNLTPGKIYPEPIVEGETRSVFSSGIMLQT
jgi:hypothetical protein